MCKALHLEQYSQREGTSLSDRWWQKIDIGQKVKAIAKGLSLSNLSLSIPFPLLSLSISLPLSRTHTHTRVMRQVHFFSPSS